MSKIKRRICVVTGTRAEYGLLYWLLKEIKADPDLDLQIIVTGMHLSPEFGLTYKVIEADGFTIDQKVEMLLSSDTPVSIAKSMGLGTIGFADAYELLKPDLIVLLGDRFEMLSAAQAAMVANLPIAHIAGGDTTEGAFDEAIRHSITKMAHLHFVTNELSLKRVRQLGENPDHIYNVGSPGLDYIRKAKLLSRNKLEKALNFRFLKKNLLVTWHPVTLELTSSSSQFEELLTTLKSLGEDYGIIFTMPNADTDGRILMDMIDHFVKVNENAKVFTSLGQLKYLSLMDQVDAVVGNSSSGIYEAPSFKVPTVNIGDRQKGRLKAESVIDCPPEREEILSAINSAMQLNCENVINPYGDGKSSERIIEIIKAIPDYRLLLKKYFYELEH